MEERRKRPLKVGKGESITPHTASPNKSSAGKKGPPFDLKSKIDSVSFVLRYDIVLLLLHKMCSHIHPPIPSYVKILSAKEKNPSIE